MSKKQGKFDIPLEGAKEGGVVTRFPPEPSGHLHIGHVKAVLLNEYFARLYGGKFIIRFDDTNPLKESKEYEDSIMNDLELLEVKADVYSRSSDYFGVLLEYAGDLVKKGLAYADCTPVEKMRENRDKGIESECRSQSIEENAMIFEMMKIGNPEYASYCLRAKISVNDPNKAMRDPVIYRCCFSMPHHKTKDAFKVYPTYDFACPVIDSLEGVTHSLRTSEYCDRKKQFYWFIDNLGLDARPFIWEYSRVNFVETALSKRKLTTLVEKGYVEGWDDPRLPTIKGIMRKGLTLGALKTYMLMQGASKRVVLLEWDKIWAMNRKEIDQVSYRFTSISDKSSVLHMDENSLLVGECKVPLYKEKVDLGFKKVLYDQDIFIDSNDASLLESGEEITLMGLGNIIIESVDRNERTEIHAKCHFDGDYKLTKKKINWISCKDETVKIKVRKYGSLITKKKLDEGDNIEDFVNAHSLEEYDLVGESALMSVEKGQILQLERRGWFICDATYPERREIDLIVVPDGKNVK